MAAEFSAGLYRHFAGVMGQRGKTAAQARYLGQAARAVENPSTKTRRVSLVDGRPRWDFGSVGRSQPGFGTGPGVVGLGSPGGPGGPGGPGSPLPRTPAPVVSPAMRAANLVQRTAFKGARTTFKSSVGTARAALKAGTIDRKAFTKEFRAAAKTQLGTVKGARAAHRQARRSD